MSTRRPVRSTDGWAYAVGKDGRLLVARPNQRAAQSGLDVLMNLPQLLGPADRKD